jgi:hypothetical protein
MTTNVEYLFYFTKGKLLMIRKIPTHTNDDTHSSCVVAGDFIAKMERRQE